MKHKNWTLILGGLMLALLTFTLVFPEWFTGKNPYALSFIRFSTGTAGELKIATPPYNPSTLNVLGSDQMGRDLLSFLVYGSRLTLLLSLGVALSRFAIAIPLGIAAGMNRAIPSRIIDRFNLVLTTIPPLLIAILVLRMDFLSSLYRSQSTVIFILTLTLIGWSKVSSILSKSTAQIMTETYILSEQAIGKRPLSIAKSHVLPHLLPEIFILFFMEIASVLTLMMQLGLFSVFVGNLKIIRDSARDGFSYFNVTFEPEWSSLLGSARDYIRVAPWIALASGAMFFFTVLAFNLFGEGLRLEFQKKNHNIGKSLKCFLKKEIMATVLVLIAVVVWLKLPTSYEFSKSITVENLQSSQIKSLNQTEQIQKLIKDQMIKLKIEPLPRAEAYIQSFESKPQLNVQSTEFKISSPLMSLVPEPLVLGTDYMIVAGKSLSGTYDIVDVTESFYDLSPEEIRGKLLYVDTQIITPEYVQSSLPVLKEAGAVGVILPNGLTKNEAKFDELLQLSIAPAQKEAIENLFKTSMVQANISINGTISNVPAQNIYGQIVGHEKSMAQNTIIIGMDYHAVTPEKQLEKLAFYLNLMSNLKSHASKINRTIVFAFFDGSEGMNYYCEHALIQNKHVNLYLDLTEIDGEQFSNIHFSDELSPISRYYGFIFANQFKNNAKDFIDHNRMGLNEDDRQLFLSEGFTTLNFKTSGTGNATLDQFGRVFIKTLIENAY